MHLLNAERGVRGSLHWHWRAPGVLSPSTTCFFISQNYWRVTAPHASAPQPRHAQHRNHPWATIQGARHCFWDTELERGCGMRLILIPLTCWRSWGLYLCPGFLQCPSSQLSNCNSKSSKDMWSKIHAFERKSLEIKSKQTSSPDLFC